MQNRLKIAMYLRLSKEDDRNTQESNSISTFIAKRIY